MFADQQQEKSSPSVIQVMMGAAAVTCKATAMRMITAHKSRSVETDSKYSNLKVLRCTIRALVVVIYRVPCVEEVLRSRLQLPREEKAALSSVLSCLTAPPVEKTHRRPRLAKVVGMQK